MEDETRKCIETCNALLRGEISAVEVYGQAIEKFLPSAEIGALRQIMEQHQTSCFVLTGHVEALGGDPSLDSGAWGTITTAIQGTANFIGEDSAVSSLIAGEKIGIGLYEQALEDGGLTALAHKNISEDLLPPLHRHVVALAALRDDD